MTQDKITVLAPLPSLQPNISSPLQPKSRPDSSEDIPSLPGLCEKLAEGRGL